jgi:ribosomal protein S12 methylthiotransferase accessory factor
MLNNWNTKLINASYLDALPERLYGRKTGIIKQSGELLRNNEQPKVNVIVTAITNSLGLCQNQCDPGATGTGLDIKTSYLMAYGEAAERYCAALSEMHPHALSSYRDLKKSGHFALSPDSLRLFSFEQYTDPEFRFLPFSEKTLIRWIKGKCLINSVPVYVPAAYVFNGYKPKNGEPSICPDIHPGVACGSSLESALFSALNEVIERDAMMIWWLNGLSMPGIEVQKTKQWNQVFCGRDDRNMHFSFLWLRSDINVPVVFCLLTDKRAGVIGSGCAARLDPHKALWKAICESVQTWLLAIHLKKVQGGNMQDSDGLALFPQRLFDTIRDKTPGVHVLNNLIYYFDRDKWDYLRLICQPKHQVLLSELPNCEKGSVNSNIEYLLNEFKKIGLNPAFIDLTTPDVAEIGWRVVRTSVPGAVPNLPMSYPPLGLTRLQSVPKKLGFDPSEYKKHKITAPLPYS